MFPFINSLMCRDNTFHFTRGPNLPKGLIGHCQVYLGVGNIFVYGGINNTNSWIWHETTQKWHSIPSVSPCEGRGFPYENLNLIHKDQCTLVNDTFIVTLRNNCTSMLDTKDMRWTTISEQKLPLNGYLLSGVDPSQLFYIGGSDKIFQWLNNEWTLMAVKLPFSMSWQDAYFTETRLNITNCQYNDL